MSAGEDFVSSYVWSNPMADRSYILLHPSAVQAWNESRGEKCKSLTAFPTPGGGTHYGYHVRSRFVEALRGLETKDRVAFMLNQIFPWTVIKAFAPDFFYAYNAKTDAKVAAMVECNRNRMANIDKKEIISFTSNKSASRFAREQRNLQR